jgi:hypothetical protein
MKLTTHHHVYIAEFKNEWSDTSTPAYGFMAYTGRALPLNAYKVKVTERMWIGFIWLWLGFGDGPFKTL